MVDRFFLRATTMQHLDEGEVLQMVGDFDATLKTAAELVSRKRDREHLAYDLTFAQARALL